MKDVQNERDERKVKLDFVGVKGVWIPIKLKDKKKGEQVVQAKVKAMVNLSKHQKGVHMSHLVDPLYKLTNTMGIDSLMELANEIKDDQTKENNGVTTHSCMLSLNFKYFMDKEAPASKEKSMLVYDSRIEVVAGNNGYKSIRVKVPVSTCCPCSLELCENKAAHNQRGIITITIYQDPTDSRTVWIEDLIEAAEKAGSCEIYPVLRRPDEQYVTYKMFEHAKFVEDCVRDAVLNIKEKYPNLKAKVSCENMESIHDHSAYAETVAEKDE